MGPWQRRWTVVLAMVMCSSAALADDKPITFGDNSGAKSGVTNTLQVDESPESDQLLHRSRRQLLDGWTPLRDTLSTLENVDDLLRTTVPAVDQLNCLERFMCEMSSGSIMNGINEFINPTTPVPLLPLPQPIAQFPTFQGQNQAFQQFQQRPAQAQPSQFQQFQQPPQQGFPQQFQQQSIPQQQFQHPPQQGFPPQGHPQSIPQNQFQQPPQQGFPPQGHPQQGFQHNPALQQHIDPNQVQQTFDPTFQQGGFVNNPGFQQFPTHHSQQVPAQHFSQFRETSGGDNNIRRGGETQGLRRKKPQRSGIMRFIGELFGSRKRRSITTIEEELTLRNTKENKQENSRLLSRNKRGLLDSLLSTFNAFSPDMMLRLVDQYMVGQQNSLYPYSHAAIMGYTGNSNRCERMYPKCPTNPDEMIHVFNNIRRYYPEGMPFADQLPWPLRDIFK